MTGPDFERAFRSKVIAELKAIGVSLLDLCTGELGESASIQVENRIFKILFEFNESYLGVRTAEADAGYWIGEPKRLYLKEYKAENFDSLLERVHIKHQSTEFVTPSLRTQAGLEQALSIIASAILKYFISIRLENRETDGEESGLQDL